MKLKMLFVYSIIVLTTTFASAEMVGFWRFCEGAGNTIFDYSEYCNDAVRPANSEWISGVFDGALELPTSKHSHIFLNKTATAFDRTDKFSLSVWTKIPAQNDKAISIFSKLKGSLYAPENPGYEIMEQLGRMRVIINSTTTNRILVEGSINIQDSVWHHLVMTYDGSGHGAGVKLFVDAVMDRNARVIRDTLGENSIQSDANLCIGGDVHISVEDAGVFNHELSLKEIGELYKGNICAFLMPFGQKVIAAGKQADALIAGKKFNDAIALLESNIKEYELWSESKGDKVGLCSQAAMSNLYHLLAQAKTCNNALKQEIAVINEKILRLRGADPLIYGSALEWFFENESPQKYEQIIRDAIGNNIDYISQIAAKSDQLVNVKKAEIAVTFLETTWKICDVWYRTHPDQKGGTDRKMFLINYSLAKAKEAMGCTKSDIATCYRESLTKVNSGYQFQQVSALKWLLDNECIGECKGFVRSALINDNATNAFRSIIAELNMRCQATKGLIPFEQFLNMVCTEASDPYATLSWLADGDSHWSNACRTYLEKRPRYVGARYMANDQFKEAGEYYTEYLKSGNDGDQKTDIEFQICKCTFMCGEYGKAISQLKKFIDEHKSDSRILSRTAKLMEARCYIQLGQIEAATDGLYSMLAEDSKAKDVAEIKFIIGYCYMLQGKNKEAIETFSNVISDFKDSPSANKARMCLAQVREKGDKMQPRDLSYTSSIK